MSDSLKSQISSRTKMRRRQIVGKVLAFRRPSMIEKQRARNIKTKPKRWWPREDDAPSLAVYALGGWSIPYADILSTIYFHVAAKLDANDDVETEHHHVGLALYSTLWCCSSPSGGSRKHAGRLLAEGTTDGGFASIEPFFTPLTSEQPTIAVLSVVNELLMACNTYPNKLRRPGYPRPRLSTRSRLTTPAPKTYNLRSSYSILVLRHHQDGHSSKQASTRSLRRANLASGNSDPAACRRCSLRSDTHHNVPTPDGGLRPETSTNRSLSVVPNGQWLRSASVPLTRHVHFAEVPGCLGYSTKRPQSTKCPLFQTNRKPLAKQSEKTEASKIVVCGQGRPLVLSLRVGTGRRRRQWAEGSRRGTTLPGQQFGARCDRAHSRAIGKKGRSFDGRGACLGRGMDASLIASPSRQVDIEMTKPRRERIVNDWTCPVPRAGGKAVEGWAGPVFAAGCAVETWMLAW
ncbi:uncharacterized protein IWZ02DRAFT_436496 [Phyllosticta citriasiana]|uniref:uncharacterized protein n=1 Tax=Phyllosticta citriasiana TaxID=595635 RepID=UPI0030FDE419